MSYILIRKRDGLRKVSDDVLFLEFKKDGTHKSSHNAPAVGRSLLMSPFNRFFTWQTTLITEIIEKKKEYVRFKTENSEYTLFYPKV